MNARRRFAGVAALCAGMMLGTLASRANAAEGIDPVTLMAIGDDESDYVVFDHVADPARATRLRFVGVAQSRQPGYDYPVGISLAFVVPTGEFRYDYYPNPYDWHYSLPQPTEGGEYVSVPIDISYELPFSPERVGMFVEGYGPADRSFVEGTFFHTVVPEPSAVVLALGVLTVGVPLAWRRFHSPRAAE